MTTPYTSREAVGLFHDAASLNAAVDSLFISGFDRSEISLLANRKKLESTDSKALTSHDLEDDPEAPRTHYTGTDSLTELSAALIGGFFFMGAVMAGFILMRAGATNGSVITWVLASGTVTSLFGIGLAAMIRARRADYQEDWINAGGLLLWVHTKDPSHEADACKILKANKATDVHVHDMSPPKATKLNGKIDYGYLDWLAGYRKAKG